ncbi:MAG TPA: hypothetical protein PK509_05070 [Catalimonadaceae bacterium]|nr:hypothetical protein [Catalimonadaceae bacterium]HPI10338.1 hypothetical protein [Catalimonadaceae bacterium]
MKKTILFILLALALGAGAWWSLQKNKRKSTLDKLDLNFSVADTASISKVVVTQFPYPGKPVTLDRLASGYWKLNKQYKASPVLMDVLLTTIRNVEMQRPLAPNEAKTVNDAMKTRYRKVEIYVKGELYKTYLIGDDAPENKGTYFKLENGDPYVCYLRGFNGFLTPRYNVTVNDWRDRLLISSTPQTIQTAEVRYTMSPADNFKVGFSGKYFNMEGASKFDTIATAEFLLQFKKIYVERFLNGLPQKSKDSLLTTPYEWSLDLVDIDKEKSHLLNFYPTSDPDRSMAYLPKTNEWITIQNRNLAAIKIRRRDLLQ